jgi:2-polyprenyl-3-methyl-5-hydroxy-6-metoxy-1,4-benzoquinol methylase
MESKTEQDKLENIAVDSWYGRGVNASMVEYSFRVFSRHLRGESILELGPAEGIMTALLVSRGGRLTMVEGAATFCEDLRRRFPQAEVVHSLFEDYRPQEKFDNIILGHILEHVEDPAGILRLARTWLKPEGRVLSAVPNSRSLHRQAAVVMGLLPFEEAMNEADLHHGHRRVFNPETFRHVFLQAGLNIDLYGGYWLKPGSNRQIEQTWTPEMLEAFMRLGERYPDIAAELYIIASLPKSTS